MNTTQSLCLCYFLLAAFLVPHYLHAGTATQHSKKGIVTALAKIKQKIHLLRKPKKNEPSTSGNQQPSTITTSQAVPSTPQFSKFSVSDLMKKPDCPKIQKNKEGKITLDLSTKTHKKLTSLDGLPEFPGIETVEVLNLSKNPHLKLTSYSFTNLPKLQRLELGSYTLSSHTLNSKIPSAVYSFPNGVFAHLPSLEILNLSHNGTIIIKNNTFTGLTNLKILRFINTPVQIDPESFTALPSLEILELGRNQGLIDTATLRKVIKETTKGKGIIIWKE